MSAPVVNLWLESCLINLNGMEIKMTRISKKTQKYLKILSTPMLFSFQTVSTAQAQSDYVTTASGQITAFQSEWNANEILVSLGSSVPFVNPAGCTSTDYYETNAADSGIQLNNSILLTAYMAHSSVKFTIQGCSANGRPRIVGITVVN